MSSDNSVVGQVAADATGAKSESIIEFFLSSSANTLLLIICQASLWTAVMSAETLGAEIEPGTGYHHLVA